MTLQFVGLPRKSWWKLPLKFIGFLVLTASTAAAIAVVVYANLQLSGLPTIPRADQYRPPIVTELHTLDGVLAGELYLERRRVIPYEHIPKRLIQAFIAAEDADFFDHKGIDGVSTFRAAIKTAFSKVFGRGRIQGGSTITQQTAKAILISQEGYKQATAKTLKRKLREALLALRLESTFSKEEILYLYLNNVYLGHQSYGVEAAAENYFRKEVGALSLAELALLAGLPQAPSTYSPLRNPDAALERRRYVLRQMLEKGMVSREEHDQALAEELKVFPIEDVFRQFAPYFSEEVRRDLVARYGNQVLLKEGLQVFTTMDSEKQRAAQEAVLDGLLALDKRQGYRGPLAKLGTDSERASFLARSRAIVGNQKLAPGKYYVGLVHAIAENNRSATVKIGGQLAHLPLLGMRWARTVNPVSPYPYAFITKVSPTLSVGDVIIVRAVEKPRELVDDKEAWNGKLAQEISTDLPLVRLEQDPEPQAAIASIEPQRQYLLAMVGGYDFDANEFNRVFQACRQPGSSFKPFVYAAAIDKLDYSQATVLLDSPIVYDDAENMNRWKPENYDEDFKGEVILRDALINSMNIPAVKTFIEVARSLGNNRESAGMKSFGEFVEGFGIGKHTDTDGDGVPDSPIALNYSSALGSSCLLPYELVQAFSVFDRNGVRKPTYFIRKIEDRFGRTLEDRTAYDDPWAALDDRLSAGYARLFEPGVQVLSPDSNAIVVDLLRGVVREGTGGPASKLAKPAAGKTGTTNDSFDAWFTGFTKDLVTTVWVGYDLNQHPLGRYETGGRAALPIWLTYMRSALAGRRQDEFRPSESLGLISTKVDRKTGRLSDSSANTVSVLLKRGTVPQERQPKAGSVEASEFLQVP